MKHRKDARESSVFCFDAHGRSLGKPPCHDISAQDEDIFISWGRGLARESLPNRSGNNKKAT
ncbi:MAG TPA: hypothetical protein DEB63_12615 [Agrobacterium sp.]|nr:hypothetical protein [Agrobacterium sp.]